MIISWKLTLLVIDMRQSCIHDPYCTMSMHSCETVFGLINETIYHVLCRVRACDTNSSQQSTQSIVFAVRLKWVLRVTVYHHQALAEFMYGINNVDWVKDR